MKDGLCSRLSAATNRPVVYNNITHRWSAPNQWREHLDYVTDTVGKGNRAYPLISPRSNNTRFTMLNAQVFDRLPSWKPIMEGTPAQKMAAFRDPETRRRLRLEAVVGGGGGLQRLLPSLGPLLHNKSCAGQESRGLTGKSIDQLAAEQGKDVLDAFLDLVLEENLETGFELNQSGGDEAAMTTMLTSPLSRNRSIRRRRPRHLRRGLRLQHLLPGPLGAREENSVTRKGCPEADLHSSRTL